MQQGGEAAADPARSLARLSAEAPAAPAAVLAQVRAIVAVDPDNAEAHRIGALALRALGRNDHAVQAERAAIDIAARDPLLVQAAQALKDRQRDVAERLLRERVAAIPQDVVAQHRLGEICLDSGRFDEAEARLRRAVALAPAHVPARAALARLLFEQSRDAETLAELDRIVALDPGNRTDAMLRPATLGRLGEFDRVIAFYEATLAPQRAPAPGLAELWPYAQDRRPSVRRHGGLSPGDRPAARTWRGVVEHRQSQDRRLFR